ncbi:c-type cytochrome [Methyloligella solikamskensis]|uniref:C-type cytochrome n=1 Tax=Methyloligella solikamskensis TaxID=1177756 RepID=A0ABW3JE56_9HYPH
MTQTFVTRPFVTICALVLTAGLLSACGPDEEETANTDETTQEEVTTETDATAETDAAGDEMVEEDTMEMAEADDAPAADASDSEMSADDSAAAAPEPNDAAGEEAEADTEAAASGEEGDDEAASGGNKSPTEVIEATEKGQLTSPYADDPESVAEAGHKLYMGFGCNGCHGGGGGGGMGPPLTNDVWVYGSDDDTLFRFITLGTTGFQEEYDAARKGSENVVGPMPAKGGANIDSADDLWKVIAWIRKINPNSGAGGGSPSGIEPPTFD